MSSAHAHGGGANSAQIVVGLASRLSPKSSSERLAEAVDAPQRRPQIVGDGVAERLELAIGRVELGQAPGEIFVELLDLGLGQLAVADVTDGGHDEGAGPGMDRAQADLHGELAAVAAKADQVEARAHRARPRVRHVAGAVAGVNAAHGLGEEHVHRLTDERAWRVTEQPMRLNIREEYLPASIDRHDAVGGEIEQLPVGGLVQQRGRLVRGQVCGIGSSVLAGLLDGHLFSGLLKQLSARGISTEMPGPWG